VVILNPLLYAALYLNIYIPTGRESPISITVNKSNKRSHPVLSVNSIVHIMTFIKHTLVYSHAFSYIHVYILFMSLLK